MAQRFADCGYGTGTGSVGWGENLAGCDALAAVTVQQWQASPHHDENLVDQSFRYAGVKRVQGGGPNGAGGPCWYWTMTFGTSPGPDGSDGVSAPGGVPTAPELRVVGQSSDSLQVAWTPVAGATGYGLYDGYDQTLLALVSGEVAQLTVSGLEPEVYYCFVLYAYNAAGTSDWSKWACTTTTAADE